MKLTDSEIAGFKRAYRADFGEDISTEVARDMFTRLLILYDRLAQPLPSELPVALESAPRHDVISQKGPTPPAL